MAHLTYKYQLFKMKLAVILFALMTVVAADQYDDDLEDNRFYGYLTKFGVPLATKIRKVEFIMNGGKTAYLGQFPYQAGLIVSFAKSQSTCGGTLINAQRVLTAAHCWMDGKTVADNVTVVLGSVTLFTGGTRLISSDVVVHLEWEPFLNRNDLAIINLPHPVSLSNTIRPIALPSGNETEEKYAGEEAVVTGFILTKKDDNIISVLSFAELSVMTNINCSHIFAPIFSTSICTDGCNGPLCNDGGPLVITRNSRRILIGIGPFGSTGDCKTGTPTVYTRITAHLPWINGQIRDVSV